MANEGTLVNQPQHGHGDGPAPVCKRLQIAGTSLSFSVFLEPPGDSQDPISQYLMPRDELTFCTVQLMLQLVKPGQFVLDLGAHLGTVALAAAAAGCHVAAVDASPRNLALLALGKRINGFDRLRLVHRAVSDRRETVRFRVAGACGQVEAAVPAARGLLGKLWDFLRGRGAPPAPAPGTGTIEVAADPVDRLVRELGWRRVDFVKMDIEGYELKALAGMRRLLGRRDAPPVLYECNGHTLRDYGQTPQRLKRAFEELGYRNYILEPGDRLIPVAAADLQPICCMDYLAFKGPLPALGPWVVAAPLDLPGLAIRVGWACGDPSVEGRRYTARLLQTAGRELLALPEAREGVGRLRADADAEVRAEATRIPLADGAAAA